jgi:putative ABC transport system substrate-binding protein
MKSGNLPNIAAGVIPSEVAQMAIDIGRRQIISALGCAAVAWPLGARAQQPVCRVAVMLANRDTDPEDQARLRALERALQQFGWVDGRNVRIDIRSTGGNAERAREVAAEFVALAPDVIVSAGSVATAAIKHATSSIPVVFVLVNEPVAQGFVASLARPGGNITGFTNMEPTIAGKWLELLKQIAPRIERVGFMFNSESYPFYDSYLQILQAGPRPVEVVRAAVRSPEEIDAVIDALAAQPGGGLAVLPDGGFTAANRAIIRAATQRHRLPSIGSFRQFVSEGALMSYGASSADTYSRSADYVDRILKGAKPANLPVQQPVKFELVINRKTATALDLEIPTKMLALADEVIE